MDINALVKWCMGLAVLILFGLVVGCRSTALSTGGAESDVFISKDNLRHQVVFNGELQVVRFIKFKGGEVKLPLIFTERPRFGAMFQVKHQKRIESNVVLYLGPRQMHIYLPTAPQIKSYQFLVRTMGGEWRFFEIDVSEVLTANQLTVPDVRTLPLLESRKDSQEYLRKYQVGKRERAFISNRRN